MPGASAGATHRASQRRNSQLPLTLTASFTTNGASSEAGYITAALTPSGRPGALLASEKQPVFKRVGLTAAPRPHELLRPLLLGADAKPRLNRSVKIRPLMSTAKSDSANRIVHLSSPTPDSVDPPYHENLVGPVPYVVSHYTRQTKPSMKERFRRRRFLKEGHPEQAGKG